MLSPNIVKELELLFSHMAIPKDILTEQGTMFISRLTQDLCTLLQVRHHHTSVYHPQINRLVAWLNQTLNKHWVIDAVGCDWDFLLPYVLFTICEALQAFTGFTPFKILFDGAHEASST